MRRRRSKGDRELEAGFLSLDSLSWCLSLFLSSVAKLCPTLATPWTVACQTLLSMGFSRQEHWSWLLFPSLMPQVIGNVRAEGTGAPNLSRIGDIRKTSDLPLCLAVLEMGSRRCPEGDKCSLNTWGHNLGWDSAPVERLCSGAGGHECGPNGLWIESES